MSHLNLCNKTLIEIRKAMNTKKQTTGDAIVDLLLRNGIMPTNSKRENLDLAKGILPKNYNDYWSDVFSNKNML